MLAGALGSQYLGGLTPCDMCHWQRWPHYTAVALALLALVLKGSPGASRTLVLLAALAILTSGAIGVYHAGVEAHIFKGFTRCTSTASQGSADELLRQIMAAPLVRCDDVQFRFLGISMAGWNAILSVSSSLAILWLALGKRRVEA